MTMIDIDRAETPLDMFYHWEASKPDSVYLRQPVEQEWRDYSWREVGEQARRIAAALQSMGLGSGERISLLSKNCAHWLMADLAIMMSGCASAPAFTSMTGDDVLYILEHSDSKVLFVGQTDNWQEVKAIVPDHVKVISLPFVDIPEADFRWEDLLADYAPLPGNPGREGKDEITTIYTSGSTGLPKGVVYSFEAAGHMVRNFGHTFRMVEEDRLISYLPLAHGFERAIVGFMSMQAGCTVGFNECQATFAADMKAVRPTVFQCVPRLWTKFQESVLAGFGGQEGLDALLADPAQAESTTSNIQAALGLDAGRILLTGSAPTPLPLHSWYDALDMPLCEIYGQSEILAGTCNLPWDRKPGTLGKPTWNTEIKITDVGEILIKAKAVMTGYLHEPGKTAETLIDGWIHTGDKGEIDEDGFLKITGRVKEIFKTTKGKYVAPVPIEGQFVSNSHLDQVCLMGNGLPQTALLVQLSAAGRAADGKTVEQQLRLQIQSVNADLDSHARIACVLVAKDEWASANGLVTHTLKIKRSAIEERYLSRVEKAFSCGASARDPLVMWESGAE
ncbi:MAG: AMP-binding protein [Gammaproteobacteria bacterium]|nr:AMP-binding protein [Gammaproteobacteria bacterium]